MRPLTRPVWVVYLFFATIVRRLLLAFIGLPPMEGRDVNGELHLLVVRRPAEGLERSDFNAVRQTLLKSGHLQTPSLREFVIAAAFVVIALFIATRLPVFFSLATMLTVLSFAATAAFLIYSIWWRHTHLIAPDVAIKAAWLKQGNCPHCAYRLPPAAADGTLCCTECGVRWKQPQPQNAGSGPTM